MALSVHETAKWLQGYGHFDNPEMQNAMNVNSAREASLLNESNEELREAAVSLANLDSNFQECQRVHNGKISEFDGDVTDPAFQALVAWPRCDCPDHRNPTQQALHEQAIEEGDEAAALQGGGSWLSCDPDRADVHSIRIGVSTDNMHISGSRLHEIHGHCIVAANAYGLAPRYILNPPDPESMVEIMVRFRRLSGHIGWNEFGPRNSCARQIDGRIGTNYNPSDVWWHVSLWMHEQLGHGIGLEHRSGGGEDSRVPSYMNPSVKYFNPFTLQGDRHEQSWVNRFGGDPIGDSPDPVQEVVIINPELQVNYNGVLVNLKLELTSVTKSVEAGDVVFVDSLAKVDIVGVKTHTVRIIQGTDFS